MSRTSTCSRAIRDGDHRRPFALQLRAAVPAGQPVAQATDTGLAEWLQRHTWIIKYTSPADRFRHLAKPQRTTISMSNETIEIPVISDAIRRTGAPLSPVVRANGFVFVSGLPAIDLSTGEILGGDIEVQTEAALQALRHTLEAAGSSMSRVVKVTLYVSNSAYFRRINKIYSTFFSDPYPARTFVVVGSWPLEFDIEVECVALV